MSAVNLRVEAPFRPVDWRWEKARLMREDPRTAGLLRHQDDEWTRRAKRFQEQLDGAADDYSQLLLTRRWPAVAEAHAIRFRDDEKRLLRYEIEARLLAAEAPREVAKRTSLHPSVVTWYEKLFFSVADRLHNRAWIGHCVIGESAHAGLTERDYDVLWKMFGYCGGPHVLDAVIDKTFDAHRPEGPGGIGDWVSDDTERMVKLRANLAIRTMNVNTYTQPQILEIYTKFLEIKKMADGSGATGDVLASNISVMIQAIPWTVGDKQVLVASNDPRVIVGRLRDEVASADGCAAELRASELMQLNTGQTPERIKSLPEKRFPEKPNAAAKQGS